MTEDATLRLDVWLDVACIFKTRSQAQTACQRGRVEVNGRRVEANEPVRLAAGSASLARFLRPLLAVDLTMASRAAWESPDCWRRAASASSALRSLS